VLRTLLLASLLAATPAAPILAQALPPGMTMHRIQAGEPDASGWMIAKSTEGGFSVRLPLKFNDFTVAESDPEAAALRIFTVGAKSREGIKFTASRIVYRKGAASARQYFSRFERGEGLGFAPERVTPRKLGGRPAVDLVIRKGAAVSFQRVVLLDPDLLLLAIESPSAHEAAVRQFVAPFFDSLVVDAR
jgi:hypothetical protein